jgi:hyperosmotically inducible protein
MMKKLRLLGLLLLATQLTLPAFSGAQDFGATAEKVRHDLVMLSRLSVFDNLTYRLVGDTVYLGGQVAQPVLKSDAENALKGIEGIKVVNQIEVLPLSPIDDGIRMATLRAVYSDPVLSRYAVGNNKVIHIIVKNGNVTLEGRVASDMERNVAGLRANGVPNVFSVTNNLQVGS